MKLAQFSHASPYPTAPVARDARAHYWATPTSSSLPILKKHRSSAKLSFQLCGINHSNTAHGAWRSSPWRPQELVPTQPTPGPELPGLAKTLAPSTDAAPSGANVRSMWRTRVQSHDIIPPVLICIARPGLPIGRASNSSESDRAHEYDASIGALPHVAQSAHVTPRCRTASAGGMPCRYVVLHHTFCRRGFSVRVSQPVRLPRFPRPSSLLLLTDPL